MIGKIKERRFFGIPKDQRDAICRARDLLLAVAGDNAKEYQETMRTDPDLEYDIVEYVRARMVLASFDAHWEETTTEQEAVE